MSRQDSGESCTFKKLVTFSDKKEKQRMFLLCKASMKCLHHAYTIIDRVATTLKIISFQSIMCEKLILFHVPDSS